MAMCAGMMLSAVYDVLRIFRNIIRHKNIFINIEDFIFWNFVGIFIYILIFIVNNGILRWFIIASAIVGAFIFHHGIGKYVVKFVSVILNYIINILLKKPFKKVTITLNKAVSKKGKVNESKNKLFKKKNK
jgi:membrane protein implicated in regulation of membrane protease activity